MNTKPDRLSVQGLTIYVDPRGGRIDEMIIETPGAKQPLRPLHRTPWVEHPEELPESVAPVERHLAGDFFCAPFASQPGQPIHGWTANGTWLTESIATDAENAVSARYRLQQTVQGARVEKTLTLRPGHPFLYQSHRFEGGTGHLPIAHHAMIHVPGGARLSFSGKRFGVTANAPPESDPARGRSLLAYPQRFDRLSQVAMSDGITVDATRYPFADGHEDIAVLTEVGPGIGWSAALAAADGFLFFAIKDSRRLPETVLWMSNGGRDYAPWFGRHTHVLGIEEAATSCHVNGRFESSPGTDSHGLPLGLALAATETAEIRYGFGAIPVPKGWSRISDIRLGPASLTLCDIGGGEQTLPFHGAHFGIAPPAA